MDMQLIISLYLRSLHKHLIMKALAAMGLSRLKNSACHFIPFHISTIAGPETCDLRLNLTEYGLKFVSAPPDGNCFFSAVAINMI